MKGVDHDRLIANWFRYTCFGPKSYDGMAHINCDGCKSNGNNKSAHEDGWRNYVSWVCDTCNSVGTWIYGRRSQDGTAILSIGAAVVVLGGSSIIRAYGHGYEKMVWNGALIAVGIGVAIFMSYFIVIYLHNRR
jgi:hypothetical protein